MSRLLVESTMLSGLKFAAASDTAKLLHFLALCYAAENLTDGFISEAVARKLTKARPREFAKAIEYLTTTQPGCTHASWEQARLGWFLHDYDDPLYDNPMKSQLDNRREQKAKAGAEGGRKSAAVRRERYGTAQPSAVQAEPFSDQAEPFSDQEESKPSHSPTKGGLSTGLTAAAGVEPFSDQAERKPSHSPTKSRAVSNSSPEADAEAPSQGSLEAPASGGDVELRATRPEADPKLARAQPFPSLPFPSYTHGDNAGVGTNGQAAPSPQVQVVRLLDWLLAKRGWNSWASQDSQKHEAEVAIHIIELGLPFPDVIAKLEAWWNETDLDDRPSSLGYFWTRLQDEQHRASKQQNRSRVQTEGLTKLQPSVKQARQ